MHHLDFWLREMQLPINHLYPPSKAICHFHYRTFCSHLTQIAGILQVKSKAILLASQSFRFYPDLSMLYFLLDKNLHGSNENVGNISDFPRFFCFILIDLRIFYQFRRKLFLILWLFYEFWYPKSGYYFLWKNFI